MFCIVDMIVVALGVLNTKFDCLLFWIGILMVLCHIQLVFDILIVLKIHIRLNVW